MEQQGDQGAVVAGRELSSVESAEEEELIERIEGYAYGKGGVIYFTQRRKGDEAGEDKEDGDNEAEARATGHRTNEDDEDDED